MSGPTTCTSTAPGLTETASEGGGMALDDDKRPAPQEQERQKPDSGWVAIGALAKRLVKQVGGEK